MRINVNFRPGLTLKKLIIIGIFALCCFLIKENVHASTYHYDESYIPIFLKSKV